MKLVIDANILFASLIKDSLTAELLLSDKLNLFAPEFLFDEFLKYEDYILKKTNRSKEDFKRFLTILREEIEIIPQSIITPFIEKADKFSPDEKDTVYLACALAIDSKIWSNDKKLKEDQKEIKVLNTEELIQEVGFIK
ncbi:MAG: DNA-binding protein [Candidatus Lokiarchaeota archaeon]|nr:DNA-binding protein [Candidatus Lokiarchaeota archaeon]